MSKLKTHGRPEEGILVLQHQNYDKKGWDLAMRAGQHAVRVIDRLDSGDGLGHWVIDPDSQSDVLGSNFWNADYSKRQISACSFGWGARVVKGSGSVGVASGGKGKSIPIALLPVNDDSYTIDDRFKTKTVSTLDKASWGKHPVGTVGIVHSGTYERTQTDVFFRADGRLCAPNFAGDAEMGSIVYDLTDDGEYDKDRGARLQSAFRVLKAPLGLKSNALSFQLGQSGLKDTRGGYYCDFRKDKLYVGEGNYTESGPFYCGDENDRHKHGVDADGNPIGALHLKTSTNFHRTNTEDGEINFTTWRQGQDLQHVVPVYIGFNGGLKKWDLWTTSALYPVPTEPTKPRPGIPTVGNPVLPGQPTEPVRPSVPTLYRPINSTSLGELPLRMVASLAGIMAPVVAMRPQNYTAGGNDLGTFAPPTVATPAGVSDDEATNAANQAKEEAQRKADSSSPITVVASAFAAQGGTFSSSGSSGPTYTGPEGDPWVYTSVPKGTTSPSKPTSKFVGGTASGGICYHPPETDLRDVSAGLVPANTTLSTVYVITGPGAWWGAGVPQLVNGGIQNGWVWGFNSTTSDLDFKTVTSSGAAVTGITFVQSSQHIRWYSGQSSYGDLAHANTGNRTYTFPDKSGTVAMTSDIGTGVSDLFTQTSDGSQTGIVTGASILSTGVGSLTVAANALIVGSCLHFVARGYYSTAAVPGNMTLRLNLGGALMVTTAATALASSMSSRWWEFTCDLTVRTDGVVGSIQTHGEFLHLETAGAAGVVTNWECFRTGTGGVDTTSGNALDLVVTFDTGGNTITCTQCIVTKIG